MAGIPTTYPPTTYAQTLAPQPSNPSDVSAFYGLTGGGVMVYGAGVIGGELFNVLSTLVGDEIFEPTYGCDLPLRVFEPITARVEMECLRDVYFASRNWVPESGVSIPQSAVIGGPDNRLVGVEVAYAYGGASWTLSAPLNSAFSGDL